MRPNILAMDTQALRRVSAVIKFLAFLGLTLGGWLVLLSFVPGISVWSYGWHVFGMALGELLLAYMAQSIADGVDAQVSTQRMTRDAVELLRQQLEAQHRTSVLLQMYIEHLAEE